MKAEDAEARLKVVEVYKKFEIEDDDGQHEGWMAEVSKVRG